MRKKWKLVLKLEWYGQRKLPTFYKMLSWKWFQKERIKNAWLQLGEKFGTFEIIDHRPNDQAQGDKEKHCLESNIAHLINTYIDKIFL